MKLAAHHTKKSDRNDIVHTKASELRVTPEEVFARAYVEAGKTRSASAAAFGKYCRMEGSLPDIVETFCKKPLPKCTNPVCPNPDLPGRFTRTDLVGKTTYFCSAECMTATPQEVIVRQTESITSAEGRAILDRVRVAMSNATYIKVKPTSVRPMPGQPRTYFNAERMKRLIESFKQVGQLTPGIVRAVSGDAEGRGHELLDGERRLRAALMAGLPEYRAMLVDIDDEAAPYVVSVIANFNREEHTLIELSDAVVKMHEGLKLTMYEIADTLGLSGHGEASKLYGLRRLVPEVRDMLDPNLIKGHVLPKLAAIQISQAAPEQQLGLAEKMMKKEVTVAGLREHARNLAESSGSMPTKRYVSPEKRRRSIELRIDALARNVHELSRILREEDVPAALAGFLPGAVGSLNDKLRDTQTEIDNCRVVLAHTESAKKAG